MKISKVTILFLSLFFLVACDTDKTPSQEQNKNLKPISEAVLNSIEFGKIKVSVFKENNIFSLRMIDLSNNKILDQRRLEFEDSYQEDTSQLEIFPVNLNGDEKDDFIILHLYPIGAGPMAGMEVEKYFAFINEKDRYIAFEKNALAQGYIDKYEYSNDIEKIKALFISLYKGDKPTFVIGEDIADNKKTDLHLLENERLIFSFIRVDSNKRLSVAIDKSQNYIVYRYGAPGKVELVYKMEKQERKDKFHYVQDDGYGYTRYEIRRLNFTINDYTYSIYNNYIEAHETAVDGVGVVIKNNKTKKSVTLKGNKTSVSGKLELLKNIDWMDVSLAVDGERIE